MTERADIKINRLRQRIYRSDVIVPSDRDALLAFDGELTLRASSYSTHRHEHLLRRCTIMAENVGGLARALDDRDRTERIVAWIHAEYDNEETNRDYRGALRVFADLMTDGDELPESVDWVSGSTSKSYNPTPDPSEMLRWDEHVKPMIESCTYARDRALIAVAWDAGCRSGEFRDLRVGDISDHEVGKRITVDGKTGQRTITLITSVEYLTQWLAGHPGDDPDDPLWSHLNTPEELSYQSFRNILQGAAERAGVDRPVTLTNFRKSSASYLAPRVSQATLERHHGWSHGSKVAARYVSVFDEDSDREIAAAHGVDVTDTDDEDSVSQSCPACNTVNDGSRKRCRTCNQVLDPELAQVEAALDTIFDRLDSALVDADDPSRRTEIHQAKQALDERATELSMAEVHDLVSSLE